MPSHVQHNICELACPLCRPYGSHTSCLRWPLDNIIICLFTCDVFNDAFSITRRGPRHLAGGTVGRHDKVRFWQPVSWSSFEHGTSLIWSRTIMHLTVICFIF